MPTLGFMRAALLIAAFCLGALVWYDMPDLTVRAIVALGELGATLLVVRWALSRRTSAPEPAASRWPLFVPPMIAAAVVRAAWAAWAQTEPISDFKEYCDLGRHLADTGVYGLHGPSAYRPPAVPAMLAVLSMLGWPLPFAAGLVNALLGAAMVPAVYLLARQVGLGDSQAADPGQRLLDRTHAGALPAGPLPQGDAGTAPLLAAWVWALWPSQVLGSVLVATEPLFTAGLLWAVVLTLRSLQASTPGQWLGWAMAGGALFGLAGHVRSHALPVPWLWCLLAALHGRAGWRHLPRMATVCLVSVVVMLPWGLRNHQQLGRLLITSTSSGVTMAYGNHAQATGRYDGPLPFPVPGATEIEQFDNANVMAKAWITANPLQFIALIPHKWMALLASETDEASYALRTPGLLRIQVAVMLVCHLGWLLAKALALGAVWRRRARPEPDALTGCAAVLWTWLLIHALFHGQFRYHAPLLPVMIALAAVALRPRPAPVQT